jgi:hypothetical protein
MRPADVPSRSGEVEHLGQVGERPIRVDQERATPRRAPAVRLNADRKPVTGSRECCRGFTSFRQPVVARPAKEIAKRLVTG